MTRGTMYTTEVVLSHKFYHDLFTSKQRKAPPKIIIVELLKKPKTIKKKQERHINLTEFFPPMTSHTAGSDGNGAGRVGYY